MYVCIATTALHVFIKSQSRFMQTVPDFVVTVFCIPCFNQKFNAAIQWFLFYAFCVMMTTTDLKLVCVMKFSYVFWSKGA